MKKFNMKKMMNWVLAATMICGASMFASCSHDDNPMPVTNLSEKIIGKWIMYSDGDGQQALTNDKEVITFVSSTKAYASRSRGAMAKNPQAPEPQETPDSKNGGPGWDDYEECDVTFEGNTVILTSKRPEDSKPSVKYIIKSISQTDFYCEVIRDNPGGNTPPPEGENPEGERKMNKQQYQRYTRVTANYSKDILGTWEGRVSSEEGSEYDDGELHRWEYKADGTFVFYFQDENGGWKASNDEFAEYFCDGTLLCTRWKNVGEGTKENREWWEIQSIKNGVMKWYGLRQREDGTTYVASFYMTKVEEE